jgi:outer membrane murein-binding lipoprotein Lpp
MTINPATLISIIALIVTGISVAFAIYFGIKGSKRNDTTDIERKAAETATINVKLDQIGTDVRDIKYDMTATKKDVQALTERMITVEQSAKSAHHRLDAVEGKD